MLNLAYVYDDAVDTLEQHGKLLSINALPPTVFLMQRDVINHYRYALSHYLPLTLDKPFLQNSSIGTPYEKWAKFTNSDFEMLSARINILLHYTVRLIHEVCQAHIRTALDTTRKHGEVPALIDQMRQRISRYQDPMCDIRYHDHKIGINVEPENRMVLTKLSYTRHHPGRLTMESRDGVTTNRLVTTDEDGTEHTQVISDEAARERMKVLKGEIIDISDRSTICQLQKEGLAEVINLESKNKHFGKVCDKFLKKRSIVQPFDNLVQEWMH